MIARLLILSGLFLASSSTLASAPPDAAAQWRSHRAQYSITARNGAAVCANARDCAVWADRIDGDFLDPQTNKVIPQLLAWKLILSHSGGSGSSTTVSVTMPIFADRGVAKIENGSLIYDFTGRVYKRGAGSFDLVLHTALRVVAGKTMLRVDLSAGGREIHDDFEMTRVPNTDLLDAPTGIVPGVLAIYEMGMKDGPRYQGIKCTVSYRPNNPYHILAWADLNIDGRDHSVGGMQFKMDQTGLFKSAMDLWTSQGTMTRNESSRTMNYFSVLAPVAGGPAVEIPVFGIGVKNVTSNADPVRINAFRSAVKSLCDQIRRF